MRAKNKEQKMSREIKKFFFSQSLYIFKMEEARLNVVEAMTNMETAMGERFDAPFAEGASSSSDSLEPLLEGEEEFQCHQPEEDEVPWVPTEAEKDAEQRRRVAKTQGVKRPRSPPLPPNFDAVPDLHEIFDNYDTPANVRVSICRAYASYISSTLPRKEKKKKASKK